MNVLEDWIARMDKRHEQLCNAVTGGQCKTIEEYAKLVGTIAANREAVLLFHQVIKEHNTEE